MRIGAEEAEVGPSKVPFKISSSSFSSSSSSSISLAEVVVVVVVRLLPFGVVVDGCAGRGAKEEEEEEAVAYEVEEWGGRRYAGVAATPPARDIDSPVDVVAVIVCGAFRRRGSKVGPAGSASNSNASSSSSAVWFLCRMREGLQDDAAAEEDLGFPPFLKDPAPPACVGHS